jgi:Zn-dependent protease
MPEVSELKPCECRSCNAKSTWAQGFVKAWSPLRGSHSLCVTCWLYRRKYRGVYVRFMFWIAVVAAAAYYASESVPFAVLCTLALYAVAFVAVVMHELGHAAAAIALGFRVPAISLGGGLHAKVLPWRNTFVLLGPSPVEGLVVLYPPSTRHYRKKMALILAAGSLVNLLCAVSGLALLDGLALAVSWQGLVSLSVAVNLLMVLNLVPAVTNGSFGPLRSDGQQLLDLLKLGDAEIARRVAEGRLTEAHLAFYSGAFERAFAVIAPALESGAVSGKERVLATAVLIGCGKTEAGIELAKRYLRAGDLTQDERAVLMNNVAWALVDPIHSKLTPTTLAEADELSAAAMEVLPMANAVRGTRGAVLVEQGAYREALALLADARFRLESPWARATVKATLALAFAGLGDAGSAARALREAAELDPGNARVLKARERAARLLQGLQRHAAALPAGS